MINYLKNKRDCRSKMIAFYFNDDKVRQCGICDNCLKNKSVIISNIEFESISSDIKSLSSKMSISYSNLVLKLSSFKENKVWKVLIFLQEENIISIDNHGMILTKQNKKKGRG
ncbi:MAG: RecQ family zinc-binding domain-containing protein [Ginsengibacter sp.]